MAGFVKDLRNTHYDLLRRAAERAAKLKPNLKVSLELQESNHPEQIVTTTAEGGFDIVVVGHGGEDRIRELFSGGQVNAWRIYPGVQLSLSSSLFLIFLFLRKQ